MSVDARTMLLLSNAIALLAAVFLFMEWRSLRERFLLGFAAGFMCIVVGCTLAPLRLAGDFVIGVWLSNSMVPSAHLLFLVGAASFAGRRLNTAWYFAPLACSVLMTLPGFGERSQYMSMMNAGFVAIFSLRAAGLLVTSRRDAIPEVRMLAFTLAVHGGFYVFKAACAFWPGAFTDLSSYSGALIPISLFEGILIEVALAMSIAGALRRRREQSVIHLAESDPLTGLLNRRGFASRTAQVRREGGALLLLDVDNFKIVNDRHGHHEGDRLLVNLSAFLREAFPDGTVIARLGGDEFAVLLAGTTAAAALRMAEQLCHSFPDARGRHAQATLSIGCAHVAAGAADLGAAHLIADRGLYEAKRKGRNQACLLPPISDCVLDTGADVRPLPRAAAG